MQMTEKMDVDKIANSLTKEGREQFITKLVTSGKDLRKGHIRTAIETLE